MGAVKHTPGPWGTAATDDSLILKGRLKIASVYPIGLDLPQEEANARLIAAAPDLLSDGWTLALMALQSKRYGEDVEFRDAVDAMLDTCRVARGEPTREQHLAAKAKAQANG